MRTELPRIVVKAGITDPYILYTDCDVVFMDEVTVDLQRLGCYFFAVAPESDPKDYHRVNTGVMFMNPKNLISMEKNYENSYF